MKNFILYAMFFSKCISGTYHNMFLEGNEFILQEKYEDAIQVYESILDLGYVSSDLYYNLGNAYYRKHYIGQAIWAYMNAITLNPRDKDIKYNLSVANAHIVDRVEIPDSFFLLEYYRNLKNYFTINEWFLFASFMLIGQALLFLILKIEIIKGKYYQKALSFFIIFNLIIHLIAFDKYFQQNRKNIAVFIANGVNAYSGPFLKNNTILFRVNEGIIADVSNTQKGWTEIILIDGKKGWVAKESIRSLK